MNNLTMSFPPDITRIFAFIIAIGLMQDGGQSILGKANEDSLCLILLNFFTFFTALIYYLNDKGKCLMFSAKGITFEKLITKQKSLDFSLSNLFLIIAIIYNPIIPIFSAQSSTNAILDISTGTWFLLKLYQGKSQ